MFRSRRKDLDAQVKKRLFLVILPRTANAYFIRDAADFRDFFQKLTLAGIIMALGKSASLT
jgi:hypothetical protein